MKEFRVLIIEDDPNLLELMKTCIEDLELPGHTAEVTTISTGSEALFAIRDTPFDLITTDLNLPGVKGSEVIAFRDSSAQNKETPVIIISGQLGKLKVEADDVFYLEKPLQVERLEFYIKTTFKKRHL